MIEECPAFPGKARCEEWECDCFIKTHPDSPLDLHPEDFVVAGQRAHSIPCKLRNNAGDSLTDHTYCTCWCHQGKVW